LEAQKPGFIYARGWKQHGKISLMPYRFAWAMKKMHDFTTFDKNRFLRSYFGWLNIALGMPSLTMQPPSVNRAHTSLYFPLFCLWPFFLVPG